jgi:hypothetical protein
MKRIDVFYIATGVYASYFDNFITTIKNFFPGTSKYIHVLTDVDLETENGDENIHVEVNKIINLPYPIIGLLKTTYINHYLTDEMEYVFYFDADTIFLKKNNEYWDELKETINKGEILMSIHPGNYYPNYELDEKSEAYLDPQNFVYTIIASFYGGKIGEIKKLIGIVDEMIRKDLQHSDNNGHHVHYIPVLFDQDYMNKVVNTSREVSFTLRYFVGISWFKNSYDRPEENFIEQKYDIERKFKTKNMV